MTTESYSQIDMLVKYFGNSTSPGAQIPFYFGLVQYNNNHYITEFLDKRISKWLNHLPENMVANWVVSLVL